MTHHHPVRDINEAIKELQEAKRFLLHRKYERAENELADSLVEIARAIRGINRKEY